METSSDDYVIQVYSDPTLIDATKWDSLLAVQLSANPFVCHAYLSALHLSGSAQASSGWAPQFLVVTHADELIAACPLYLKSHSYGEYVFDWAWAQAYERHGLSYYPKLLDAVPFTPVPGPRLLARDDSGRRLLLSAIQQVAQEGKWSSAHLLFMNDADLGAARAQGWMIRSTVQFHWNNRTEPPYTDFADFLATLKREKRKKIQQERRRVLDERVTFEARTGAEITPHDWDFFYECYCQTYREHRSTPYLTRDFFARVATAMPGNWLLFIAHQDGRQVAASLVAIDPQQRVAFGRYWGAIEDIPCLHFEACYYQPLSWCIANGYRRFEGGAQGEHKMARGLLPVQTKSAHWLAHPMFAKAIPEFLQREDEAVADYIDDLTKRQPFKDEP